MLALWLGIPEEREIRTEKAQVRYTFNFYPLPKQNKKKPDKKTNVIIMGLGA